MENNNSEIKYASSFKEQLTVRGIVIGAIGAIILTCSSMFVALKISSLPWPIMFVALVSMFALKGMGKTNINEINVAHTAMSAGSMVAGGLAFTLPGIWMLNPDAEVSIVKLIVLTLGGVILGLIFTALIRKHFVVTAKLPYPMGQAAAETLKIGDQGGKKAGLLFGSLGLAAVFTFLRDSLKLIPGMKLIDGMMKFGSAGGVWFSPMLVSVGYIIGPVYIGVWFIGAVIGDFGVLIGGQKFAGLEMGAAIAIKHSLGIGLMVGTGIAIVIKEILPRSKAIFAPMLQKNTLGDSIVPLRWAPFAMVIIAALFTVIAKMPVTAAIVTILGVWLATAMSSQCVGQTGINPMEIFGIIILLAAKGVSSASGMEAFFVAAVVAVACGLVGDVMNDFKAGYVLKTDPRAQWIAEAVGGIIGAFVSVIVFVVILKAYGPASFGSEEFPAAQAAAVAAMVGGISHMPAFIIGLVAAVILYFLKFPVMTLGLGVYLPFFLSATAFIGGLLRFVLDRIVPNFEREGKGSVIAAGVLGGEAVVGVIIAIVIAVKIISA